MNAVARLSTAGVVVGTIGSNLLGLGLGVACSRSGQWSGFSSQLAHGCGEHVSPSLTCRVAATSGVGSPSHDMADWAKGGDIVIVQTGKLEYVVELTLWPMAGGAAAINDLVPVGLLSGGRTISVCPVIFSRGVNEMQALANMNFVGKHYELHVRDALWGADGVAWAVKSSFAVCCGDCCC